MVDRKFCFLFGFAATLTLVFVASKYVFSDFWGYGNSGGFRHYF
jgi:hypothetical protein